MSPEEFYQSDKSNEGNMDSSKWSYLVEEYLRDAGFKPDMYFSRNSYDTVEIDFMDQEPVFFIIDDIIKTKFRTLLVVDYKKTKNTSRHTAVFYRFYKNNII